LPHTIDGTKTLSSEIASEYGVLIDAATGEILLSKGHDVRFNPASMTKIMTLIALCENLSEEDLDKEIVMTSELREYVTTGAYRDSRCFGFVKGDKIKLRDLLYGIGVESDADCTVLAAKALYAEDSEAVAEQKLVELMNRRVQALGLQSTHFDNIIGHESDNNYATAADMAAMMMYAMKCPLIVEILSAKNHAFYIQRLEDDGETYARWTMRYYSSLFNNKREEGEDSRICAYEKKYGVFSLDGATLTGGKTGTLGVGSEKDPWIFSLVSFAKTADGKVYIAVTGKAANAYDVMKDAKTLYEGVNS
jgi:D-alanyl-D-alanine carboxypeptidase